MALTPGAVRIAGTGEISYAAEGAAAPTDATTALDAAFKGCGYTTTDGVGFTMSRDMTAVDAWQGSKIRSSITAAPVNLEFTLLQTTSENLLLAFGNGVIGGTGSARVFTPDDDETKNAIRAMVIDITDGTIKYRYYFPRVQAEDDLAFKLARTDAISYGLKFGVLANSPRFRWFTNDTANLAAAS